MPNNKKSVFPMKRYYVKYIWLIYDRKFNFTFLFGINYFSVKAFKKEF